MVTEARETASLIGSDKVEGTAVYGAGDEKIGSIERVTIDKVSGKACYAVLSLVVSLDLETIISASMAIAEVRYPARRISH